jgi:hypothetical protein
MAEHEMNTVETEGKMANNKMDTVEGPFYESHYLYESKNTDAKFKHLRSRMSVEMTLSTKYYK